MAIFHISAECYPVAKVGGLADVVGALPKYLEQIGQTAHVVMPGYDNKFTRANSFTKVHDGKARLGDFVFPYSVLKESTNKLGFSLFIIAIPELFDRPEVYGYQDDTERFTTFQIAFLNWLVETQQRPSVLHCHDHHSGLIPFMVENCFQYESLRGIPTVLTIHNGQYQGWFGHDKIHYLPAFPSFKLGYLEWGKTLNPLASAIKCAWKVTTVSPSYLDEISIKANGLEGLLRFERPKCVGILNGIDQDVWNPATDPMLDFHYDKSNFQIGKAQNKAFLCETFHLNPDLPLFVFIGRLVDEKGADILPEAFQKALTYYYGQINILVLGSGDTNVENRLKGLTSQFSGNYNAYIGYNEALAHKIYAGADFILMPSRVEPCGLNQLYSMRYGTIPIVRRTGGLKDTVLDIGDGGWGFCHDHASVEDLLHAIYRATQLFKDAETLQRIDTYIMTLDHSWEKVAQEYLNLYNSLK
uniref:glycogen synthase n=1 Tax=Flavobacterium sp. TaxID=239 RepID=UPI00404B6DCF